ncbi:Rieske (2Fe-2S) protein [Pedobacter sp. BS3]|uniref:Rieske (2Fe-2S) protein n=1 Tax=Pedobacter sp. BS3 TaxID=2567937 RepID=UPI0011F0889E|nr:Rieske (2Fe-2S) protein [Pedobacter sp. BS3]TZF81856.1 Rieske (2Fe-2S) protein [Pedobacter sp. BS3]
MHWVRILSKHESEESGDFVRMVKIDGQKICLVRNDGRFYALQNTCPHAGGILSGGWCKNGHIVCPIHRYEYDLETGKGAPGQYDYADVYPLELRDDGLYIGMKESWWKKVWGG